MGGSLIFHWVASQTSSRPLVQCCCSGNFHLETSRLQAEASYPGNTSSSERLRRTSTGHQQELHTGRTFSPVSPSCQSVKALYPIWEPPNKWDMVFQPFFYHALVPVVQSRRQPRSCFSNRAQQTSSTKSCIQLWYSSGTTACWGNLSVTWSSCFSNVGETVQASQMHSSEFIHTVTSGVVYLQ